MTDSEIKEKLRELLRSEFPTLARLQENENIWDSGAIDSMSLVTLVDRIERVFKIRFPGEDLTELTFASTGSIAAYLCDKLGNDG